jgi:arginase
VTAKPGNSERGRPFPPIAPERTTAARRVGVIGVPTSAAAFAPGQERAPAALRDAGLVEKLAAAGVEVSDRGDREVWRWRPDRGEPRAQNVPAIVAIVQDTARRVGEAAAAGELALVLGGDCTVGIGTVIGQIDAALAGGAAAASASVGLLYFDTHADLNVPEAVSEGALDWMGMSHMLGVPGARPELVEAGPIAPLLAPEQVVLFGWGPDQATDFEREQIERRAIATVPVEEVRADPVAAARRALALLDDRCERLLVHFDVDVVDFTDTPLSENWGRNEGLAFDTALAALGALLAAPKLAAMTVTELNPDHTEPGAGAIDRLVDALAAGLAP